MNRVWQIGIIVRDLKHSAGALMDLIHVESLSSIHQQQQAPKRHGPQDTKVWDVQMNINKVGREFMQEDCLTVYKENHRSRASCMTCCLEFDNIEIEFIQPYGDADSEWKRYLEEQGEGIHHLGWKVEDMEKTRELFHSKGYQEIQRGSWGEGEYHYFDTKQAIGFVIEALKFYDKKK